MLTGGHETARVSLSKALYFPYDARYIGTSNTIDVVGKINRPFFVSKTLHLFENPFVWSA